MALALHLGLVWATLQFYSSPPSHMACLLHSPSAPCLPCIALSTLLTHMACPTLGPRFGRFPQSWGGLLWHVINNPWGQSNPSRSHSIPKRIFPQYQRIYQPSMVDSGTSLGPRVAIPQPSCNHLHAYIMPPAIPWPSCNHIHSNPHTIITIIHLSVQAIMKHTSIPLFFFTLILSCSHLLTPIHVGRACVHACTCTLCCIKDGVQRLLCVVSGMTAHDSHHTLSCPPHPPWHWQTHPLLHEGWHPTTVMHCWWNNSAWQLPHIVISPHLILGNRASCHVKDGI